MDGWVFGRCCAGKKLCWGARGGLRRIRNPAGDGLSVCPGAPFGGWAWLSSIGLRVLGNPGGFAWARYVSASSVPGWSGLVGCGGRGGVLKHGFDSLFRDNDPLAEAEGWQPAGAGHFVSEGSADAQEFSSFLDC